MREMREDSGSGRLVIIRPKPSTRMSNGMKPRMSMSLGYQFPDFTSELQAIIGKIPFKDEQGAIELRVPRDLVNDVMNLARKSGMKVSG